MLVRYIQAAMQHAVYKTYEDDSFYGEIPGVEGVCTNANTFETCREELQDVLQGWIILGLRMGDELPVVDGIDLNVQQVV